VATIIQAVSAVLIWESAAYAGAAMTDTNPIGAAIAAARRNNPAMSFPPAQSLRRTLWRRCPVRSKKMYQSVFERSGYRFAQRKRVKAKI
jgi:hypothetical protein